MSSKDYQKYWQDHWEKHDKLNQLNPQMQVARTKLGEPISQDDWKLSCEHIMNQVQPRKSDKVLDLCCGNGLLTACLIDHVASVVAVDFSQKLLDNFIVSNDRITIHTYDILTFNFGKLQYNKILLYFAAQHFSEQTMMRILHKAHMALLPGGIFLIGDVPDASRKWNFYSKPEYRSFYFSALENDEYPVGTWFDKEFFQYAAEYLGYELTKIQDQPEFMLNSNHRFDVICYK